MKIAMLGHKAVPSRAGGVEVAVTRLSRELARMGHSVTCYNRPGEKATGDPGAVRTVTVPAIRGKGISAVSSSIFAALRCVFSDADVIHIHGEGPAAVCPILKLARKRTVVTVHGLDWQREKWQKSPGRAYIRLGERLAAKYADDIIVLSRRMQGYFLETYGRETVRIPNGMEDAFDAPEPVAALEKDGYILFLGRLVPEKGVHLLIDAFRKIKTDQRLVIAGGASDTENYVNRLREMSADDRRILFAGAVSGGQAAWLYRNCRIYVLPSSVEGMPISLLEALSLGCCCAVSDIPECTEVLENRGAVFPKGDVRGLQTCLQTLLEDPAAVEAFRIKARNMDRSQYSWKQVARRTLELYNENSDDQ